MVCKILQPTVHGQIGNRPCDYIGDQHQKSELSSASDPFSEDIGRTPFELGDGFISGTDLLASIGEQADAAPPVTDADAFHFQSLSSAPGHSSAPASIGPENALEVSANGITSFLAREAADGGRIAELANALSDSQFAFVFRDDDFLRDRRRSANGAFRFRRQGTPGRPAPFPRRGRL